ncbi:MAG: tetratricopeptide repeat protein [Melioribacteraceae bacterium]|nr:tetratricopeptide repeat protein [Melioribacteraceae bacterium]
MKKITLSMLILFLFSIITINAQDKSMVPDAAKAYNEGNKLMKSGNYDGALKQYDEALKIEKDHRTYYQKGVTLRKLNKLEAAEEAFNAAIQLSPNFDVAYNGLGGTLFQDGKYAQAVDAFKKFEQLTKQKSLKDKAKEYISRSLTKLGDQYKKDGNYAKSIESLNEAVNFYPYDAALLSLAITYIENGDFDKGISSADKVLGLKSSSLKGAAYYYKGLGFKRKDDITKAKENFELAKKDAQYRKLSEYELNLLK